MDLPEPQAVRLSEILENIASANMIAQFSSKLDSLVTQQQAVATRVDVQLSATRDSLEVKQSSLESKMESQLNGIRETMDALQKSTDSRFRNLQWLIIAGIGVGGLVVAFLSVLVAISDLFSFGL